jgi:hypothetical protein
MCHLTWQVYQNCIASDDTITWFWTLLGELQADQLGLLLRSEKKSHTVIYYPFLTYHILRIFFDYLIIIINLIIFPTP